MLRKPINETWNTCAICGKEWKDKIPTKGLLHRTLVCKNCLFRNPDLLIKKNKNDYKR